MTRTESHLPEEWALLNVAVIVFSAVRVLYPPARHAGAFTVFGALVMLTYFVFYIRRLRATGVGGLTVGELYRKVKAGRRPRSAYLETAAAVALCLALIAPDH